MNILISRQVLLFRPKFLPLSAVYTALNENKWLINSKLPASLPINQMLLLLFLFNLLLPQRTIDWLNCELMHSNLYKLKCNFIKNKKKQACLVVESLPIFICIFQQKFHHFDLVNNRKYCSNPMIKMWIKMSHFLLLL